MFKSFKDHIEKKLLFKQNNKLLVAMSGGIDSVVLAHLLKTGGYSFSLAHCNFKLRKQDSDFDEEFCRELAKNLDVDLYVKHFDVKAYQAKNKVSLQMAARELRYLWFKELLENNRLDYLLTAHHGNDMIETLFINLLRGTGINGLKGIPEKAGQIIRPLLHFTKEDILAYATKNSISFRLDKSNFEDKYERNFLRLNILPAFKKLHPAVEKTMMNNIANFREEADIVNEFLINKTKKLVQKKGAYFYIDKKLLMKEKHCRSILNFALDPFGFNGSQIDDLIKNISTNGLVGKVLNSAAYTLTIDRETLILRENKAGDKEDITFKTLDALKKSGVFKVKKLKQFMVPGSKELILNVDSLIFPLTVRGKATGDRFRPFGMKGFKLLSDFFKEQKLNNFEKENCKVLVNGNGEIIWVIGYRSDDRYQVNTKSTQLIKLFFVEQ